MAIKTQTCCRCGREWRADMCRACPHPRVQQVYGENICVYCCKRCKLHKTVPYFDGIKCGYSEGK